MANGILKVGTITTSSGSGTITIPSGVSFSGGGVQNTPAFEAKLSVNQSVSDNVDTKVQFDTEVLDTDNCYDNVTNYRFTPNVAGKYYVYLNLGVNGLGPSRLDVAYSYIYKNGSQVALGHGNYTSNPTFMDTLQAFAVIDMNGTTDYIEAYGKGDVNTGGARFDGANFSVFGAYKLIGV